MTVQRLRYFVAVAEHLSFTAAARDLHMAQPPLSTQIRRLEAELGAELFERQGRHNALTAAGHALLPEARRLLERYEQLGPLARRAQSGATGELRIGLVPSAANGALPGVLARYRADHPDVVVSLIENRPGELLRQLGAGEIDVALLYSHPDDPDVCSAELAYEALVLALRPDHRLAARRRIPVRALAGEPIILPARHGGDGLYERITALLAEHAVTPRVVQADVWMMQTIVGLVSAGLGLAIVPASAAVLRPADVAYRPLSASVPPAPLVAAWRPAAPAATVAGFVAAWPLPDGPRRGRGAAPAG